MATDDKKQTIREEFFRDSFPLAQKQRFGLFSSPVSNAIGDDHYFISKKARKDADGHVITDFRNFTTKPAKKGNIDSVYFMKPPSYVSIGDPYTDAGKLKYRGGNPEAFKEAGHDRPFKPAKDINRKVKADFEHMQVENHVKKNHKDPEGHVVIEPKNIQTNPMKKGQAGKQVYLGGKIDYKEDPFDNKKVLERKELEEHHSKLQEKPFSQKVKGRETFSTVREAFGEDRNYPQKPEPKKGEPLMLHDKPFYPSKPPKIGYNKTLEKFPPYMEDPLRVVTRKKTAPEGSDEKPNFRPTHRKRTVPCPSVTTNYRNLKTEFPSIFRKL